MQKSDVQLFIGGEWRKTANTLPIINPADETEIGQVAVAEREDLEAALQAAWDGYQVWRNTAPAARAAIIMKASALMRERREEIARAITLENGKPISEARRGYSWLRILRMGCWRVHSFLWPRHSERARHSLYRRARANRSGRSVCAVEFPDEPASTQDCGCLSCRLLHYPESFRGNTDGGDTYCACIRGCRPASRCAESGLRRSCRYFAVSYPAPGNPGDCVHWIDCRWQTPDRNRCAPHETGADGTWRPRSRHRLRGCRSGRCGYCLGAPQIPQFGSGMHLADALLRSRKPL